MKFFLLSLVIITLSSMSNNDAQAETVFSWLDENGVMHFTDKKPPEVEVQGDKLTTKTVEVTNILESENITPNNDNENNSPDPLQSNNMPRNVMVKEDTNAINSSTDLSVKQQPAIQKENVQMTTNEANQPIAILELSKNQ
ncbi:DUF4124 domain-containing protein [Psychromonas sp. KJ10-10]|uniref:DUF4124 domain-containing protein n=1 Tax=Psychromonas sp. KJ10-10 TaxID=3391823 RepID=UPI0039B4CEA6